MLSSSIGKGEHLPPLANGTIPSGRMQLPRTPPTSIASTTRNPSPLVSLTSRSESPCGTARRDEFIVSRPASTDPPKTNEYISSSRRAPTLSPIERIPEEHYGHNQNQRPSIGRMQRHRQLDAIPSQSTKFEVESRLYSIEGDSSAGFLVALGTEIKGIGGQSLHQHHAAIPNDSALIASSYLNRYQTNPLSMTQANGLDSVTFLPKTYDRASPDIFITSGCEIDPVRKVATSGLPKRDSPSLSIALEELAFAERKRIQAEARQRILDKRKEQGKIEKEQQHQQSQLHLEECQPHIIMHPNASAPIDEDIQIPKQFADDNQQLVANSHESTKVLADSNIRRASIQASVSTTLIVDEKHARLQAEREKWNMMSERREMALEENLRRLANEWERMQARTRRQAKLANSHDEQDNNFKKDEASPASGITFQMEQPLFTAKIDQVVRNLDANRDAVVSATLPNKQDDVHNLKEQCEAMQNTNTALLSQLEALREQLMTDRDKELLMGDAQDDQNFENATNFHDDDDDDDDDEEEERDIDAQEEVSGDAFDIVAPTDHDDANLLEVANTALERFTSGKQVRPQNADYHRPSRPQSCDPEPMFSRLLQSTNVSVNVLASQAESATARRMAAHTASLAVYPQDPTELVRSLQQQH